MEFTLAFGPKPEFSFSFKSALNFTPHMPKLNYDIEHPFVFEQSIALTILKCKCYILYNLICFICFLFQLLRNSADY